MAFSYAAVVTRTPAYDGATVRSPEPVFRRLTKHRRLSGDEPDRARLRPCDAIGAHLEHARSAGAPHHRDTRSRPVRDPAADWPARRAGVVFFIARRTAPDSKGRGDPAALRTAAGIGPPDYPAPNFPLIEVAEFATLAKLAERCGLLVLHCSRSEDDTFIVLRNVS